MASGLVKADVLDDVLMVQVLQEINFEHDVLEPVGRHAGQRNLLDGDHLASLYIRALVHEPERPAAQLLAKLIPITNKHRSTWRRCSVTPGLCHARGAEHPRERSTAVAKTQLPSSNHESLMLLPS